MDRFASLLLAVCAVACATGGKGRAGSVPIPPPTRPLPELAAALGSAVPEERAQAAWQLAGATDVPADLREALHRALESDPEARVRLAAAWALGHVEGFGAAPGQSTTYDEPPKLIAASKPVYPVGAYAERVEGTVALEILIDETGRVAHAEVRESIPALDGAALACVRGWTFSPAKKQGRPVATFARAPVAFRIY